MCGIDAYFRKTGLERADCISKDLEWFSQQGNVIPEPSNPGVEYSKYLEELAETNPPLFLCHFYNIYFSHIAGGQVIAEKVQAFCFIYSSLIQSAFLFSCQKVNLEMLCLVTKPTVVVPSWLPSA